MRCTGVAAAIASLVFAAAAPAGAIDDSAGAPGFCTDDDGTTVVVDFSALGGDVIVRCAPGAQERTGFEALEDAGFAIDGTTRFGQGTVCRIEGRPAADEELAVDGNAGYREACIDMPPSAAYWSYWSAENGGTWDYSQYGVQNREAIVGGFEGWSFALNSTSSSPSAPHVDPTRPATSSDGSDDAVEDGSSSGSNGPDGSDGRGQSPDESGDTGAQGESSGQGLPKPMKRDASPPPTAGTQNGVEWSGGERSDAAASTASDSAGSDIAPWVAGGVIAALAALIAATAVRRRARRGDASP